MQKFYLVILFFLIIGNAALAQTSPLDYVRDTLLKREKQYYNCDDRKMTLDKALDEFIYKTFDKVVIGNDEFIKNGTALNLSVTDKTKLSGNYLFKINRGLAASFGLNATVSNNEAVLVNNEGYFQSGWGLTAKLSFLPGGNGGRFLPDSCRKLSFKRQEFISRQLHKYDKILKTDIQELDSTIARASRQLTADSLSIASLAFVPPSAAYGFEKMKQTLDSLKKVRTEYYRAKDLSGLQLLDNIFEKDIHTFEKDNAPWSGYTMHWFDLDMSMNTSGKTIIYNSEIVNTDKISENEMFWKYRVGPSYNWATYRKGWNLYVNVLLAVQNAYALEGKEPVDTFNYGNLKVVNKDKGSAVYDISLLPNYKDQKLIFTPSVLVNSFFGKHKMIGGELFYETLFRNNLEGVEDNRKVVMNGRIGIIINFSEKYKTTLPTLGLFLKATEYNFKDTLNDYLSIGLRVGVPFDRIFNKKS
jgi:hypothetical protein